MKRKSDVVGDAMFKAAEADRLRGGTARGSSWTGGDVATFFLPRRPAGEPGAGGEVYAHAAVMKRQPPIVAGAGTSTAAENDAEQN